MSTDLNTDAVTFSGETSSYLTFDLSKQPSPLDQTIVLSFRTFQSDALLLYAYDHLSNFVQMELQQGDTILFTYNTYRTIVSGSLTAPGIYLCWGWGFFSFFFCLLFFPFLFCPDITVLLDWV